MVPELLSIGKAISPTTPPHSGATAKAPAISEAAAAAAQKLPAETEAPTGESQRNLASTVASSDKDKQGHEWSLNFQKSVKTVLYVALADTNTSLIETAKENGDG